MPACLRRPVPPHCVTAILALAVLCPPALAQLPPPLDSGLWAFPGTSATPASAASAGLALADRWLGEQPFDNPAAAAARGLNASGLLQRVNRQDLRSTNRQFDEQAAFIDFAGAWLAVPVTSLLLVGYTYQPELRLEDNAFTRGEVGGPVQPAVILSNGAARELRTGLAISRGFGHWRAGVAGEWTHRADAYEMEERSGSPNQGVERVEFSGDAFAAQVGARYGSDRAERGAFVAGAAARFVPALTVDGSYTRDLLSGSSRGTTHSDRGSGVEFGGSLSYRLSEVFRAVAGVGGRTERNWEAFGVRTGSGAEWALGGEYHDDRDPWTVRFGAGQEFESGAAEDRGGRVGLGLAWRFDRSGVEVGLLHRSIHRDSSPTSYDDRVVTTVTARF